MTATLQNEWYSKRLFVKPAAPTIYAEPRQPIRTLSFKPPAKYRVTACMLCCTRPIDNISNCTKLTGLKLYSLAASVNQQLSFYLGVL
jgi:hypothetical protein